MTRYKNMRKIATYYLEVKEPAVLVYFTVD